MYNKKKFIEGLNGVLDLIPDNISPEGIAKKKEIKENLKNINDKNQSAKTEQSNPQDLNKKVESATLQD